MKIVCICQYKWLFHRNHIVCASWTCLDTIGITFILGDFSFHPVILVIPVQLTLPQADDTVCIPCHGPPMCQGFTMEAHRHTCMRWCGDMGSGVWASAGVWRSSAATPSRFSAMLPTSRLPPARPSRRFLWAAPTIQFGRRRLWRFPWDRWSLPRRCSVSGEIWTASRFTENMWGKIFWPVFRNHLWP